ncbi:MAG: alpha/beta fold hydrolase [Candidatus Promineifilaceae bacterium]
MAIPNPIPHQASGRAGPWLHFAHANAYPPAAYRALFARLAQRFRLVAIEQRPLWPGSRPEALLSWRELADDLIALLDQLGLSGVIGAGHSLGAVVTLYAAVARPELFRAVALIDPVFLKPAQLARLAELPRPLTAEQMPLVKSAQRRRKRWASREAAFARFRSKEVFGRLDDAALWDYVNSITRPDGRRGVALSYPAAWEARIYGLPPADVWELLPRLERPTLAIRAAESDTISREAWALWQQLQPEATFVEFAASSHLLPMERPAAVAEAIEAFAAAPHP